MSHSFGVLILAGGKNSRMGGCNKALLIHNGSTFLSHLDNVFASFHEKLLSTDTPHLAGGTAFTPVPDEIPGQGPLGGVATALGLCISDALIVLACDMPLLTVDFVEYLQTFARKYPQAQALVVKDRTNQLHPLCGIYYKSAYHTIRDALMHGERCACRVFYALNGIMIPLKGTEFPDFIISNINTPKELEELYLLKEKEIK